MKNAYLSLGSNLGNRLSNLHKALEFINLQAGKIVKTSNIYETEPWGFECSQWFLNLAVQIQTYLEPFQLLETLQQIERTLGRQEKTNDTYKPRIIDIDIIFYDQLIIHTPTLIIPHRLMHKRNFVLKPLAEIAPDFVHPLLNETVEQLLKNCTDTTKIIKTRHICSLEVRTM